MPLKDGLDRVSGHAPLRSSPSCCYAVRTRAAPNARSRGLTGRMLLRSQGDVNGGSHELAHDSPQALPVRSALPRAPISVCKPGMPEGNPLTCSRSHSERKRSHSKRVLRVCVRTVLTQRPWTHRRTITTLTRFWRASRRLVLLIFLAKAHRTARRISPGGYLLAKIRCPKTLHSLVAASKTTTTFVRPSDSPSPARPSSGACQQSVGARARPHPWTHANDFAERMDALEMQLELGGDHLVDASVSWNNLACANTSTEVSCSACAWRDASWLQIHWKTPRF